MVLSEGIPMIVNPLYVRLLRKL